jgi:integrase
MKNLSQAVDNYLKRKIGSWEETTIRTVRAKLLTAGEIGFDGAKLYHHLKSNNYSSYTIKVYFVLAREFERYVLKTSHLMSWMKENRLLFKHCYKKKIKSMSDDQYGYFLKLAEGHSDEMYNFVLLLGRAGLRLSEALGIKRSAIKDDIVNIESGKGQKQRFVPFKESWLKGNAEVVVPTNLNFRAFFNESFEGFTPHDFRSYYANKVGAIPTMSLENLRKLLGHNDIRSTAVYLRSDLTKAHKLIMENFG